MKENYYQILGLDNFASLLEIKQAYRKLAKKYHPDTSTGTEEQFKRINNAYKSLINPTTKQLLDDWLKQPESRFGTFKTYNRPSYTKRTTYYTSEKTHFTPKIRMYGTIFTIGFFLLAVLVPIGIMYKASSYHYNQGLEYKQSGQYGRALMSFKDAITLFGEKSEEACIAAARIGLDDLRSDDQANHFISKGFEFAKRSIDLGELHYLKGRILRNQNNLRNALAEFSSANNLGYSNDSISLQKGIIYAFYLEEYDSGILEFENLLAHSEYNQDALFGKAWCTQKLNRPLQSIELYNKLLNTNADHVLGNFYRGHNNIVLGDTAQACQDFKKAMDLGYQPALIYYTNQCLGY